MAAKAAERSTPNARYHVIAAIMGDIFAHKLEEQGRLDDPLIAEVVTVTPEMAGDWMARNIVNRPLRIPQVNKYVGMIERGEWVLNGETVKFDVKGNLVDGQHRLTAILELGASLPMLVVFGCGEKVFATLDQGKRRTVADMLALRNEAATSDLSSCLSWLWKYETDNLRNGRQSGWPTATQALDVLERNPHIRESIRFVMTGKLRHLAGRQALAVAHYILNKIDEGDTESFFEQLASGTNLAEDEPIYRLRERLMADRVAKNKMPQHERIAIIFKAWNAWRVGRPVRNLSWRGRGEGSEAFPIPS